MGPRTKISAASQAVVSGLATQEAERKSEMSDVVKSLYGKWDEEEGHFHYGHF